MSNPIYKNAIRSKRMIKETLLELLSQKNISEIKIKEIIEIVGISKGTFYTHYEDIYSVLDDIENECIENFTEYLSKINAAIHINDFLPFINQLFYYFEGNKNVYTKLFRSNTAFAFMGKIQNIIVDYMLKDKEILSKLKDERAAHQFFYFTAAGTMSLIQEYYTTKNTQPLKEITETLNSSILYGIFAIKKHR